MSVALNLLLEGDVAGTVADPPAYHQLGPKEGGQTNRHKHTDRHTGPHTLRLIDLHSQGAAE